MTATRGQHLLGKEIGSCVLQRLLGYGGSSAVFLARSLNRNEEVAVKVFLPRSTLDGQMRKSFYRRFLREAEAASQLDHPHILSIYAYGEHDGMPYIVMPYMPGGTLSEYIQQHGPLSLQEALRYLEQIAAALDYAHTQGCVHCDVKPANILLNGAGNAALSDFGIVCLLQTGEEAHDARVTTKKAASEALMGTPDYVSPEQALGEPLDGRSDVYSLGATLYALLTCEPPFKADTPIALALMHVHETPTPVGLLRADVTPEMDLVLARALAKWPEERFQSAGAFAQAFAQAVREKETVVPISPKAPPLLARLTGSEHISLPLERRLPSVEVRPLAQPRVNSWRILLLLSVVVLLIGGCVMTELFLDVLTARHSQAVRTHITLTSSAPFDALADDQQNWPVSSTFFFQNRVYLIHNAASLGSPALAFYANHVYTNFRLQVTAAELQGSFNSADYYGVAFCAPTDQSRYYLFDVTAWNNGQYSFLRYDGGDRWTPLAYGPVPAFHPLPGQRNTLSVEARDSTFTLFVDGQQVGKPVHDNVDRSHLTGGIGLVVEEQKTEIAFSQLSISPLLD